MTSEKRQLSWFYRSRTLYVFAEQLVAISVPIILYQRTDSAALSAFSFFAIWAPRCIFPFVASRLIDAESLQRQVTVIDALRLLTFLVFFLFPGSATLLLGVALLSLLNLWAIAIFEKALQYSGDNTKAGQEVVDDVTKFSSALRADRVALSFSAIIGGATLYWESEGTFLMSGAAALILAHVFLRRSGILNVSASARDSTARIWQSFATVLGNVKLRGLIILMWYLNIIQGICFAVMPAYLSEIFGYQAVMAALVFLAIHVTSWIVLRLYPGVSRRIDTASRLTLVVMSSSIAVIAGFAFGNVWAFVIGLTVGFSLRNWIDVEIIIERNRHISKDQFGQIMTIFLPLIYAPFAVAGVFATMVLHYADAWVLTWCTILLTVIFMGAWVASLRSLFEDASDPEGPLSIKGSVE